MPILPRPYPQEVLGGFLCRVTRRMGISKKLLHRIVLNGAVPIGSFHFPSGLEELGRQCGMSPLDLLYGHTVFPYALAYSFPETAQRIEARLYLPSRVSGYNVSALGQGFSRVLKFCPACVQQEVSLLGEPYWHREHQLAGVTVCITHSTPLVRHVPQTGSQYSHPGEFEEEVVRCDLDLDIRMRIAELSSLLLKLHKPLPPPYEDYRIRAASAGYVKIGRLLASAYVSRDLHHFYGDEYLKETRCAFPPENRIAWPALLLRPSIQHNCFSTLRHILLQVFLEMYRPEGDFQYPEIRRHSLNYKALDKHYLAKLESTVKKTEGKLNLKQLFRAAKFGRRFRRHRPNCPLTCAFLDEFIRSSRYETSKPKKRTQSQIKLD